MHLSKVQLPVDKKISSYLERTLKKFNKFLMPLIVPTSDRQDSITYAE